MPKQIRPTDTEKLTLNLGVVDLGRIDLLVDEGFYTNRSDFIRTAIRAQLTAHAGEVGALIERRTLDLGLKDLSRHDLEAAVAAGTILHLRVVGLARIAEDVTPELARRAIGSVEVLGAFQAPKAVREALADRMK